MYPFKNEEITIVIGESEVDHRQHLEMCLRSLGFSVRSARDGNEVVSILRDADSEIALVIMNTAMPGHDGLATLREIRSSIDPNLPVILFSAAPSTAEAVLAMKIGAADYLSAPVRADDLGRALNACIHEATPLPVDREPARVNSLKAFAGTNSRIREIHARLDQIGSSGVPVLIQGETGSGKEVLARAIHAQSPRAGKPFLKLNCAALPSELVESELFGYERGAFTGAFQKKAGMFELADGGTILLDEIGDMDVRLQAKLLQVLQDQEFRRVGGKEAVRVDVRVLAATHRDLEKAIQDRLFREDLYYRLNVITLEVPPLRERKEDIIAIGEFLIRKHAFKGGRIPSISLDLRHAMMSYHWPGNVRELENYMRKLVVFQDCEMVAREIQNRIKRTQLTTVRPSVSAAEPPEPGGVISLLEHVTKVKQQAETDAILSALNSTHWNRKQAAAILKIDYKSLLYKMKKLGIDNSPVSLSERVSPSPVQARAANGD
jgi:two-component system response regulator AtoC